MLMFLHTGSVGKLLASGTNGGNAEDANVVDPSERDSLPKQTHNIIYTD
jgi:hypothetical protein